MMMFIDNSTINLDNKTKKTGYKFINGYLRLLWDKDTSRVVLAMEDLDFRSYMDFKVKDVDVFREAYNAFIEVLSDQTLESGDGG